MPAPLSEDLRQRIVYQFVELRWSIPQISVALHVCERTVVRILDRYGDGDPLAGRTREGVLNMERLLGPPELQALWEIVHHSSDMYLDELREALFEKTGTFASETTIWRGLQQLDIVHVKVGKLVCSTQG
jgi:transposase